MQRLFKPEQKGNKTMQSTKMMQVGILLVLLGLVMSTTLIQTLELLFIFSFDLTPVKIISIIGDIFVLAGFIVGFVGFFRRG